MVGLLRLTPGALFASEFEIRERLAEGGMGTVYAAIDRASGQPCALKVLLPELVADETTRRRFAQEARIGIAIDSPHVPRVWRAGIDDATGMPWIAMDLLRGHDLYAHVKQRGPLPAGEAAAILGPLGDALAAAHARGLIHRDLKPQNVFLEDGARVKLLDFGVAKLIDLRRASGTGTAAIGSPLWMAPEQTSAGGRISAATDVFAYGMLAFYVLTGRIYWRCAHDGRGVIGLMTELFVDDPVPAAVRAREIAPGVQLPPAFDAWFARATSREPAQRFRDAGEAAQALGPVLAGHHPLAFAETAQVAIEGVSANIPAQPVPRTDPPAPVPAAAPSLPPSPAEERRAVWPWVLAFGVTGALACVLLSVILWVVLTITGG